MATRRFIVFGPRPARYDHATFDGIGADLRIAFGDQDEGAFRMRDLIEKMRAIEARPSAAATG
jgi:hypothetical protein